MNSVSPATVQFIKQKMIAKKPSDQEDHDLSLRPAEWDEQKAALEIGLQRSASFLENALEKSLLTSEHLSLSQLIASHQTARTLVEALQRESGATDRTSAKIFLQEFLEITETSRKIMVAYQVEAAPLLQTLSTSGGSVNYFSHVQPLIMMMIVSLDFYDMIVGISQEYVDLQNYYSDLTSMLEVLIGLGNWFTTMYNRILAINIRYGDDDTSNGPNSPASTWNWQDNERRYDYSNDVGRTSYQYLNVVNSYYLGIDDIEGNYANMTTLYNRSDFLGTKTYDWYPVGSSNLNDLAPTAWRCSVGGQYDTPSLITQFASGSNASSTNVFYGASLIYINGAGSIPNVYYLEPEGFDAILKGVSIASAGTTPDDVGTDEGSLYTAYHGALNNSDTIEGFNTGVSTEVSTLATLTSEVSSELNVLEENSSNLISLFYANLDAIKSINQTSTSTA